MSPLRRHGPLLVLLAFLLGVGLMIPFEATLTRVLGMAFLFAFIVGGLFLIAEPGFLADDEEEQLSNNSAGEPKS
jgi:hypothetical protein